jgi:hypothetical protein
MSNETQAAPAKPAFVLAAITPDTASNVAKGLVKAAGKAEGATRTLLQECTAIVRALPPITAAQWDKQVAPSIRDAFKRAKGGLVETTQASYRSRFKTAGLAIASGIPELQPIAGETFPGYLGRIAEPLGKATLADGRAIFDPTAVRPGRAAGVKVKAPGTRSPEGSKGATDRSEGVGMNRTPQLAAALILTGDNEALAQRLVIVMQSYRDDFTKWTASILSEADKAELGEKVKAARTANRQAA